jgi:hypothetical protein
MQLNSLIQIYSPQNAKLDHHQTTTAFHLCTETVFHLCIETVFIYVSAMHKNLHKLCLRHCPTSRKVTGSILNEVTGGRSVCKAGDLTPHPTPTVQKMWQPRCFLPYVRDQVSQPYRTIGKIIVLYILIFKFFERMRREKVLD